MRNPTQFICYLFAATIFSGCSSTPFGNEEPYQFGDATHAKIAKHAIAPDPILKENTFIPADRDRVQAAREAYQTGNVKKLESSLAQID